MTRKLMENETFGSRWVVRHPLTVAGTRIGYVVLFAGQQALASRSAANEFWRPTPPPWPVG